MSGDPRRPIRRLGCRWADELSQEALRLSARSPLQLAGDLLVSPQSRRHHPWHARLHSWCGLRRVGERIGDDPITPAATRPRAECRTSAWSQRVPRDSREPNASAVGWQGRMVRQEAIHTSIVPPPPDREPNTFASGHAADLPNGVGEVLIIKGKQHPADLFIAE